jgi:hypothetical protein
MPSRPGLGKSRYLGVGCPTGRCAREAGPSRHPVPPEQGSWNIHMPILKAASIAREAGIAPQLCTMLRRRANQRRETGSALDRSPVDEIDPHEPKAIRRFEGGRRRGEDEGLSLGLGSPPTRDLCHRSQLAHLTKRAPFAADGTRAEQRQSDHRKEDRQDRTQPHMPFPKRSVSGSAPTGIPITVAASRRSATLDSLCGIGADGPWKRHGTSPRIGA